MTIGGSNMNDEILDIRHESSVVASFRFVVAAAFAVYICTCIHTLRVFRLVCQQCLFLVAILCMPAYIRVKVTFGARNTKESAHTRESAGFLGCCLCLGNWLCNGCCCPYCFFIFIHCVFWKRREQNYYVP